jgi:hypothetical protein
VLSLAFALAILATAFFLAQFAISSVRWSDADRLDQPIAGWMTPRYVSRSWNVPGSVVAEAVGLDMDGTGRRITLDELAEMQGRDLDELVQVLNAAVASERARSDD